ncbi:DMT family transporter [Cohnella rhizosphaerae]|uniref:DMT family transporter n=1 Tax=Cohnella rhizosphaerae TaxID=1457232 RepID=A0A9X4KRR5_9BACL|nr:DMT family transporter [Cohnella rhizosphaerae]MDG0809931.1 DMT family transporter [Cohnella rhizosphaerae]
MHKSALPQLVVSMAIFGSVGFFSSRTGLPAVELVFVRCVCAFVILLAAWVFTGSFRRERWDAREALIVVACGVSNLLNWVFLFTAFRFISVTIAISLYHLAPILALVAGGLIFRDKLGRTAILSLAGCLGGTMLIMGAVGFGGASANWKGIFCGVLAAFFYAATMLLGRSVRQTSVYATTFIQMAIGLTLLLPFVHFDAYEGLARGEWIYAVTTGIVHTGVVYLLFFGSIRRLPSPVVAVFVFVDPAVAILLDIFIDRFRPDGLQSVGILLLFGSLLAAFAIPLNVSARRRAKL